MWDASDDIGDPHAATSRLSKSSGFSLDDAFSEDDGILDAALEFNPAEIRAALARTLATGTFELTESQNGCIEDNGGNTNAGASDLNSNHDRNGSVKLEDPDASVSTLDINAPAARAPVRTPGEWSRSTSYSYGHEYRQDSQDSTSGVESLANFSRISLSDSVHGLVSVGESLEPSEGMVEEGQDEDAITEEDHEGLFRTVHIDLSQGGKPRIEELGAVLPEPTTTSDARTPSPKPMLFPSLQSASNHNHISPPISTPTSNVFQNYQNQRQSVSELPSQTTYHRSAEYSSLGGASSATTSGSITTPNSTTSPPNSSQLELPRYGGHRHSRSVGPSTLDKVISKTRPTFLPPKAKTEDNKHLADWEAMMKQSRVVGESHLLSVHSVFLLVFSPVLWEDSSILTLSSFSVHL